VSRAVREYRSQVRAYGTALATGCQQRSRRGRQPAAIRRALRQSTRVGNRASRTRRRARASLRRKPAVRRRCCWSIVGAVW